MFEIDISNYRWIGPKTLFLARLLYRIINKFGDAQLQTQSTSLAYTTLLSLIPMLAVVFSVLQGFGVQNKLEPLLMQSLEPLGEQGKEIGENILNFVNNMNIAVLGFLGVALLFWTVISLLQRVEQAFNSVWHVPNMRSWMRRFSDYLSVAMVGPVLIVLSLGLTTMVLDNETVQRVSDIEPFGWIIWLTSKWMPQLLMCAAFAFLYAFLTNIRVRLIPALAGGLFAGVGWYTVGYVFAHLVATSSKYSAIYSGFAGAVLFFIWLNIAWMIILVGAHVARYCQNPHLIHNGGVAKRFEDSQREATALQVMTLIGRAFYFDERRWTAQALAEKGCGRTPEEMEDLLGSLQRNRLIIAADDEPSSYVPARAIETIPLLEITRAVAAGDESIAHLPAVRAVIDKIDGAVTATLEGQTLRDLVVAGGEPAV